MSGNNLEACAKVLFLLGKISVKENEKLLLLIDSDYDKADFEIKERFRTNGTMRLCRSVREEKRNKKK